MQEHRRNRTGTTAERIFGTVLREIRRDRGFSQEELAFESGYHATYIGQLERGQKSPSLRTIMNLSIALGTPGSEMLRKVESIAARAGSSEATPKRRP
jgi:transcriptional regulator with XRE-family HTH domain